MKLTIVALLLVAISATAANAQTSVPADQIITLSGFGQPLPGIQLEASLETPLTCRSSPPVN